MSTGGLLLSDSRFPAGGHAHSGGVEPAVTAGTVAGLDSLALFLRGRLRTSGLVAAAVAAAACAYAGQAGGADRAGGQSASGRVHPADGDPGAGRESAAPVHSDCWDVLDAETDARTPAPAQREASRRQGRALLRAARTAWPDAGWLAALGPRPHHAVVLGAAAAAAGCDPGEAGRIAAYQAVAGPVSAAVRLLALDPMRAAGVLAGLAPEIDQVAVEAARYAGGPPEDLPCPSAPALDLLAETHIRAEVRLFES